MASTRDKFTIGTICPGGFCNLVLSPPTCIASSGDNKVKPNKILSKYEKKLKYAQERERALRLMQFILTKQEYELLDEMGDLVRLKAGKRTKKNSNRVDSNQIESDEESESFWVNDELVNSCKKEHRPELARLAFAEFVSSDEGKYHAANGSNSVDGHLHPPPFKEGHEDDVLVCRVCHDAYLLLEKARNLLKSYESNHDDQEVSPLDSPPGDNNQSEISENHAMNSPIEVERSHIKPLKKVRSKGAHGAYLKTRQLPLTPSASFHGPISHSSEESEKRGRSRSIDKSFKVRTGTKKDDKQLEENSKIDLLIADSDEATIKLAKRLLEKQGCRVDYVSNGDDCLQSVQKKKYSVLLLSENLSRKDTPSIVRWIRKKEKSDGCRSKAQILILVQRILSVDYHVYNDAEVDGFLPKPLEGSRLIPVIQKSILEHQESMVMASKIEENPIPIKSEDTAAAKSIPAKGMKPKHPCPEIPLSIERPENSGCSGLMKTPAKKLKTKIKALDPAPTLHKEKAKKEDPISFDCVFHYDEKTSFPYAILSNNSNSPFTGSPQQHHPPWCNMIVCHDVFDNLERLKVFVLPMVTRYPGMKVLLWNYPGQAFTTFTDEAILNNKFHAECLTRLLKHVKGNGREKFNLDEPFFLLGHGSGAAIATYYSAVQRLTTLKGLVLVNGLSHVDSHYASVFHDCRNVFECSPESRPDLPIYFYARFLFSPGYLSKTSSSLALNIYTAVHNPITLRGRKRLCQGVLNHVDTRPLLKDIASPIISIHGENATLVRAVHASEYMKGRTSCPTIAQALRGGNRTAVVLMKGGHELFQERKEQVALLLEQIVTGYHNKNRLPQENPDENSFVALAAVSQIVSEQRNCEEFRQKGKEFEDKFLNQVIEEGREDRLRSSWNVYQEQITNHQKATNQMKSQCREKEFKNENPTKLARDRTDFDPNEYPEVKEYMAWRIRRHKKRLAAFDRSARIIQGALRVFMAKTMISRLKRQIAATRIQSYIRGILGRNIFKDKKKEMWAAMLVQRAIRGHKGRNISYNKRMERKAQISVARMMRGLISRRRFCAILKKREFGATKFQSTWRMHMAVNLLKYHRRRRSSSIVIQRIFRGRLGRRKADLERDKYIFSRSQNSGIELARQIVIEHKLHATKLQSEISLLDEEINKTRNQIEFTETEIKNFERNVSELEGKSHQLSKRERENFVVLKGSELNQFREEKRRMDKEFSETLSKIVQRKKSLEEQQVMHEDKMKIRLEKRGQFKKLEAKLVVLLEAQDSKLEFIRKKQEKNAVNSSTSLPRRDKHVRSLNGIVSPSRNSFPHDVESASSPGFIEPSRHEICGETERFKEQVANFYGSAEQMLQFNLVGSVLNSMAQRQFLNAVRGFQGVVPSPAIGANNYLPTQTGQHVTIPTSRDTTHIKVDSWSINDVSKWLKEIGLEQYQSSFKEGAVDGSFLYELTDDDLRSTLGVEHKLHRKKILSAIKSLMNDSESQRRQQTNAIQSASEIHEMIGGKIVLSSSSNSKEGFTGADSEKYPARVREVVNCEDSATKSKSVLDIITPSIAEKTSVPLSDLDQLRAWVRHQKHENIREALDHIFDKPFNTTNIRVQYVEKIGTVYTDAYEREPLNINRPDEHGNTLFHIAAQSGNIRIAKLLLRKGANPNHQNKQGQTPGHFAFAYKFFNFGSWLFDEKNGGADDQLLNVYGLGPYDGLEEE